MTKFSAAQQSQLAQIGAFLRENREKQGKSLEDVAIHTYIRPQLLNGIEMGDPDMLPEPIFVQGFIRRYAENLGLKGVELSQQFTVNSIPSTPRPAPRVAETESSTTRLARPTPLSNGQSATASGTTMFSAGSASVSEPLANRERDSNQLRPNAPQSDHHTLSANAADIPLIVDDAVVEDPPLEEATDIPVVSNEAALPYESSDQTLDQPLIVDDSAPSEYFSAKVAAFDQANLDPAAATTVSNESGVAQGNNNFDDELPAAFTTQVTRTEAGTAPRTAYSSAPVGVDIGDDTDGPNLKPFAIGAVVLAALTAGVVLLANLLGGDREPSVAESPEPALDPPVESVESIEPSAPTPAPAPPVSSSPVYVEAEATAETYVSTRIDGVIVFEKIMQPGDTLLWEGEEVIDVYSGNAGGLTISANGGPSEVLGEDGQLGQKIFEAP